MKVRKTNFKWTNYSWGDRIFLLLVYGFMFCLLIVCVYPLYFTVVASISDPAEVYLGNTSIFPKGITLEAYKMVFKNKDIWRGYGNSVINTVLGTCYSLFLTIPVAYALSKKRMLGKSVLTTLFIITMYFSGGMVPTYMLMSKFGLLNTRLVLIISGGLSVYNVIVTRTFFQNNIPDELYEAARIDGANELYIFWKVALPLSTPIIAVMALYYSVRNWSDYFTALMYINKDELQPLQIILRRILIMNQKLFEELSASDVSAAALASAAEKARLAVTMKYSLVFIASAPLLIAYPFVQKHFVKGIMVGSLKG